MLCVSVIRMDGQAAAAAAYSGAARREGRLKRKKYVLSAAKVERNGSLLSSSSSPRIWNFLFFWKRERRTSYKRLVWERERIRFFFFFLLFTHLENRELVKEGAGWLLLLLLFEFLGSLSPFIFLGPTPPGRRWPILIFSSLQEGGVCSSPFAPITFFFFFSSSSSFMNFFLSRKLLRHTVGRTKDGRGRRRRKKIPRQSFMDVCLLFGSFFLNIFFLPPRVLLCTCRRVNNLMLLSSSFSSLNLHPLVYYYTKKKRKKRWNKNIFSKKKKSGLFQSLLHPPVGRDRILPEMWQPPTENTKYLFFFFSFFYVIWNRLVLVFFSHHFREQSTAEGGELLVAFP